MCVCCCLLEEGRESEFDFRSQPRVKKKIILYLILLYICRRKPNNLREYPNAPFEGALTEIVKIGKDCCCHYKDVVFVTGRKHFLLPWTVPLDSSGQAVFQ